MADCIFCKMLSGEIPAKVAYEDEDVFAFHDINPQAPTHILVIPRKHIPTINDLTPQDGELVGKLYLAARHIAQEVGIADRGFRTVMNCNLAAGQTVYHLHLHLLGGRQMTWPPG
ncbi:MAG: histidine triad nucleotide-binding protein [Pseudomonadota bacterium]|nr:histidine triad nucleotide-binding protein [Pseudomonadota bacterium]